LDRRSRNFKVRLPARKIPLPLDVLIEPMGRVNFGVEVHDRKGLHAPVKLDGTELTNNWQVFNFPLDDKMFARLRFAPREKLTEPTYWPAFWRATVNVEKPGDTFLDLRSWGKGVVWLNGHCLGRFWNI